MTTTPARPYTDDDLAAEAVLLGVALSRPPSLADLVRSLHGQYIPSRRADDGTGPTYGDLLDTDGITALARAVHERITELDCDRCDDTGLDPAAYTVLLADDGSISSYLAAPCQDCRADAYKAGA